MQPSPVLSFSTSQREGWKPNVSPPSDQHPSEFGLECQYFGCYYADPDDALYIYTFPTATCTFSAQSRVQSLPTATYASPVLSSTLVKPTTYSPYTDYPSNINANSTGTQIGKSIDIINLRTTRVRKSIISMVRERGREKGRERERERGGDQEREREREREGRRGGDIE